LHAILHAGVSAGITAHTPHVAVGDIGLHRQAWGEWGEVVVVCVCGEGV
jgi:hypothetical protein